MKQVIWDDTEILSFYCFPTSCTLAHDSCQNFLVNEIKVMNYSKISLMCIMYYLTLVGSVCSLSARTNTFACYWYYCSFLVFFFFFEGQSHPFYFVFISLFVYKHATNQFFREKQTFLKTCKWKCASQITMVLLLIFHSSTDRWSYTEKVYQWIMSIVMSKVRETNLMEWRLVEASFIQWPHQK